MGTGGYCECFSLSSFRDKLGAQSLDLSSLCLCVGFYQGEKMFIHLLIPQIFESSCMLGPLLPTALSESRRKTVGKQSQITLITNYKKIPEGSLKVLVTNYKKWTVFSSLPHPVHPMSGGHQNRSLLLIPTATTVVQAPIILHLSLCNPLLFASILAINQNGETHGGGDRANRI